VFIPKPDRNSSSGPRDYRPISLTSFLLKTMERLVDTSLSMVGKNVDVKTRKAHNVLWACRRASGARALKPKVVHWLYVATVRPSISFASLVWRPDRQTTSAKKRLSKVQRFACLGITGAIRTTPTGSMEALTGLPPLDVVIQGEASSAAHRLWSLGCWSFLHPFQGHRCKLTRLQNSDPRFHMGVDVMKAVFSLEPKYRVAKLTREKWTRGPGTPPAVKGLVWFTGGSRTVDGDQGWGLWAICRQKAQDFSRKTCYSLSG